MLIKQADSQDAALAELERRALGTDQAAKFASMELRNRRAGLRAEQKAAYLIDFDYAKSENWAVLHDLRLEHGGRVAQIDHVLINRWMDVYVLETKSFHAGLKITEDGEFLRLNRYSKGYDGMPSPIQQNERHIEVLRDVVGSIELPTRLGVRISPSFQSFVLVDPSARVIRPKKFDTSRVIKADQLKKAIWRDIDNENSVYGLIKTAAKIVSSDTVENVARQLAALHRPLRSPTNHPQHDASSQRNQPSTPNRSRTEPVFSPPDLAPKVASRQAPAAGNAQNGLKAEMQNPPACKQCRGRSGSILYGKFGYYFKCAGCGANTSARFSCQPGHTTKIRKDGNAFYRECQECGSSALFHRNKEGLGQ